MIRPYKRHPPHRGVGLVMSNGHVRTEDRVIRSWESSSLDRVVLYADRSIAMDAHVLQGRGSVLRWNDVAYRWEHRDRSVHLLGGWPGDDERALAGLAGWRDFLEDRGAGVGNIRQASRSLLRATVHRPLMIDGGSPPPVPDVIGGRQAPIRPPGYYDHVELWDIEAAYARTLGELHYGGRWYDVGPGEPHPDAVIPAVCHAEVWVPRRLPLGPIPRRRVKPDPSPHLRRLLGRDYPTNARLRGWWSWSELRAARRAGCTVHVDRSFVMPGMSRPFLPWWEAVEVGRRLPGYAGRLVKATGNALWGSFAADGARTRLSYATGDRVEEPEPVAGVMPQARALAEVICAEVRTRLWSELIEPHRHALISVHTDGGIADHGRIGSLPAGWRSKGSAEHLIYLGPQVFSYRTGDEVTYKVSGVAPSLAPAIFHDLAKLVLGQDHRRAAAPREEVDALRLLREHFPEVA